MKVMRTFLAIVLAWVIIAPLPVAQASIILNLELPQLIGRADKIFLGRAISQNSHWTDDKRRIVTDVSFQVEKAIRGVKVGEVIVVRSQGGSVGGVGMLVAGSPTFEHEERAVLFTENRGGDRFIIGMQQGAFRIFRHTDGKEMVQAKLTGLDLATRTGEGLKTDPALKRRAPEELKLFIKRVEQTIALCAKEKSKCVW